MPGEVKIKVKKPTLIVCGPNMDVEVNEPFVVVRKK